MNRLSIGLATLVLLLTSPFVIAGSPPACCDPGHQPARWGVAAAARPATVDASAPAPRAYFERLGPDAALWFQHVQALASPAFEGRAPGSRGIERAADYIEFYFREFGLKPVVRAAQGAALDEGAAFRQRLAYDGPPATGFETNATLAIGEEALIPGKDFVATSNAGSGAAAGPITFVGYGIEDGEAGYSSFDADTSLRGRVALLMRLESLDREGAFRWAASGGSHSSMVDKLRAVIRRGAAGVLLVNPPGAQIRLAALDALPTLANCSGGSVSIPTAMISPAAADNLLKQADPKARDLATWRRLADEGAVRSVNLSDDVVVRLRTKVTPARIETDNVVGALPGRGRLKDRWLVIGGHYDHVGRHEGLEADSYFPGADDNASGSAAMILLAKRLTKAYAASGDRADLRSILFVAFTSEETGLIGSAHFVENSPIPLRQVDAMLNLDMIGRLRDESLWLAGMASAAEFADVLRPVLAQSGLRVITDRDIPASDHVSFLRSKVPALFLTTGGHDEMHTPNDVGWSVDPAGAIRIVDLTEKIADRLARHPSALTFVAAKEGATLESCGACPSRCKAGATAGCNSACATSCAPKASGHGR